jgi:hypothetical protein
MRILRGKMSAGRFYVGFACVRAFVSGDASHFVF